MSDLLDHYDEIAAREDRGGRWASTGDIVQDLQIANDPGFAFELAVKRLAPHLHDAAGEAFARGIGLCESPIESVLFPWLLCQVYPCFEQAPMVLLPGEAARLRAYTVAVCPQYPIGRRRADFVLAARRAGPIRLVVVECDGRAFHQDVHADVDRDAELLCDPRVLDVHPLTGSEIWRDPRAAAVSASRALVNAWAKTNRGADAKFAEPNTRRILAGAQL